MVLGKSISQVLGEEKFEIKHEKKSLITLVQLNWRMEQAANMAD
jgi:hypothetical protein